MSLEKHALDLIEGGYRFSRTNDFVCPKDMRNDVAAPGF
jgi:hypothetical protein